MSKPKIFKDFEKYYKDKKLTKEIRVRLLDENDNVVYEESPRYSEWSKYNKFGVCIYTIYSDSEEYCFSDYSEEIIPDEIKTYYE